MTCQFHTWIALMFFATLSTFSQNDFKHIATLTGDNLKDAFGHALATGDINGDGFADLIVGAPGGNYVKIFLGGNTSGGFTSTGIDTTADYVIHCDQLYDAGFGYSITCGDVNGDGIDDLIIGAPYYSEGGILYGIFHSGKVYIYYGESIFDTIPDKILLPSGDLQDCYNYDFGWAVAVVGDVNGDKKCDLAVLATGPSAGGGHGTVSIFYGGADFNVNPALTISGKNVIGILGESITGVGDINQDGYDDILVGAFSDIGRAYLVYGGNSMDLLRGRVYLGDTTTYGFGRYLANLYDINGDGMTEVGIEGATQLVIISVGYKSDSVLTVIRKDTGWGSFQSIASCRDMNEDGLSDFVIGIQNQTDRYAGKVFAFLGRRDSILQPMCELTGTLDFGYLGCALVYCGKMSNNAKRVLCVGEDQADGTKGPGRVQIYNYDFVQSVNKSTLFFPQDLFLRQNYPNPFNGTTTIQFEIKNSGHIVVDVFNTLGQQTARVFDSWVEPGIHYCRFESRNYSSGVYFYRLMQSGRTLERSMLLIR